MNLTPKAKATKAKINTWEYVKLKHFCTVKKINNKMKRQPTEGENIFANHLHDKGFLSKIYPKKSYSLIVGKKTNNLIKTWTEDLNRHFSKENI